MKLLIASSHPVQYHAPVFAEISRLLEAQNSECLVVYLSDFSIKDFQDSGFNQTIKWDTPLLSDYRYQFLDCSFSQPKSFWDLGASGIGKLIKNFSPDIVFILGVNYIGLLNILVAAKLQKKIAIYRAETNDAVNSRSFLKSFVRSFFYHLVYRLFDFSIAIGSLNYKHFRKHGFEDSQIGTAFYCVPNDWCRQPKNEKQKLREQIRSQYEISNNKFIIMFCGKLISKKNPGIILDAVSYLSPDVRSNLVILFVGSGNLVEDLSRKASQLQDIKVIFPGFINQSHLPRYYFASDLFILPSRQQGETWGLVVNEALHAGLPCIVSNHVGCASDFENFPYFQILSQENPKLYGEAILKIYGLNRDFDRYQEMMEDFTVQTTASKIVNFLNCID